MHTANKNSNLCAKFNKSFVDKIDSLKQVVANQTMLLVTSLHSECTYIGQSFNTLPLITLEEVNEIIMSIPTKSSPLDFLPTASIKDLHLTFSDIIATLANLSFAEGVFPNSYKSAIVRPIL